MGDVSLFLRGPPEALYLASLKFKCLYLLYGEKKFQKNIPFQIFKYESE